MSQENNSVDNSNEEDAEKQRSKGVFTIVFKTKLNVHAPPFVSKLRQNQSQQANGNGFGDEGQIRVGITKVPVNAKIWNQIAASTEPIFDVNEPCTSKQALERDQRLREMLKEKEEQQAKLAQNCYKNGVPQGARPKYSAYTSDGSAIFYAPKSDSREKFDVSTTNENPRFYAPASVDSPRYYASRPDAREKFDASSSDETLRFYACRPNINVSKPNVNASKPNINVSRPIVNAPVPFGPCARPDGCMELRLKNSIKVTFTVDNAVMLTNAASKIKIALSSDLESSAILHPNGKVHEQMDRIDIVAYDGAKRNNFVRYAKMYQKGISLTSDGCALIYLVDKAGTRTTSDPVTMNLCTDYCNQVFMKNAAIGPAFVPYARKMIESFSYWKHDDGTENYDINGLRISQTTDGLVKISRVNKSWIIRVSSKNGSATLTTPNMHCTASMGATSHLFVRREERRMHFDGAAFVVRNAGHSAGFDPENLLRVY